MNKHWIVIAVCAALMVGCSSNQQKPPQCSGDYVRINPVDKYPAAEDVDKGAESKGGKSL
jgi:hypothetical protein